VAQFDFDCAVIGGGPAGLVASLYLGRYRRPTVQFAGGRPRAFWIPRTHNLLGYAGGISGRDLLRRLEKQVKEVDVTRMSSCAKVRRISGGFAVEGEYSIVTAKKVILATGMEDVQPIIPNILRLRQQALLRYCPICDAFEYSGKSMVVLSQDDHGLKTGLFLRRYSKNITVIMESAQKPSQSLVKKCERAGVRLIRGRLDGIERRLGNKGVVVHLSQQKPIEARVCYVALGTVVNDLAWRHFRNLDRASDGRIQVDVKQQTNIPGLYAIGDCTEGLAQISVAAGQAATAATAIHNELQGK
jgi:thioredoxin reductase (NADPH)